MAVTKNGSCIVMTAAADAVTGKMKIQKIVLDHTGAANAIVQNTATGVIAALHVTTSKLTESLDFPKGLITEGIIASTLSAGTLYVYLSPE